MGRQVEDQAAGDAAPELGGAGDAAVRRTGTPDDVERWAAAFDRVDRADERPTVFAPLFFAFGRRPGP